MTVTADCAVFPLVRDAIALVFELPTDELHGGTLLVDDLGADSLAIIETVEVTEELLRDRGLEVRVDDRTLAQLKTLNDLVAAVAAAVSASGSFENGWEH